MAPGEVAAGTSSARGPYKKSVATRQKIIDAALAVFAESGYRNGSTAKIAVRAGISVPQIFYYFPTEEAVLDAVLTARDRLADDVAGPLPTEPRDIPEALLRIAMNNERAPEFISLYSLLVAESTAPGPPARPYFREMESAGMLAPGIDAFYAATSTLALGMAYRSSGSSSPRASMSSSI